MALKNTLETQDPYAVLVVSTTGINSKSGFDKHSPTRVQVTEFEFDDEMKQYAPTLHEQSRDHCRKRAKMQADCLSHPLKYESLYFCLL